MTQLRLHNKTYLIDSDGFFSPAETRELRSWLQGMAVDEAAFINSVSIETVKTHRRALREKTEQHSGIGVLTYCLVHGYIRPVDTYSPLLQKRHQLMYSLRAAVSAATTKGVTHGAL